MCFAVTTWNCLLRSRGMASLQPYREESPPSHDVRWRSATAWPPRSPDLTPLDFCCGVTGRTKCSSAKQPSQVVESPHKGRCSYGNPQNVLQNTRTEVEYRLDICCATTGDTQKSTKVRTHVKRYVCKGAKSLVCFEINVSFWITIIRKPCMYLLAIHDKPFILATVM